MVQSIANYNHMFTSNSATMPVTKINLDTKEIREAHRTVRAIDHKLRMRMLDIIATKGTINVTELYIAMRLEQSVASQHLSILKAAGLIKAERNGKFIDYSVNMDRIDVVREAITKLCQN